MFPSSKISLLIKFWMGGGRDSSCAFKSFPCNKVLAVCIPLCGGGHPLWISTLPSTSAATAS